MRRHQIGAPEPYRQRQLGAVHHRAGSHRGLPAALGAFIGPRLGVELPCLPVTAFGTDEAVRPAGLRQISGARGFIGETLLKFEEGAGEIGHGEHLRGPHVRFMFYTSRTQLSLHLAAPEPTRKATPVSTSS